MKRFLKYSLVLLVAAYLLLLIPDKEDTTFIKPSSKPFAWNKDTLWKKLESDFRLAKMQSAAYSDSVIQQLFGRQELALHQLKTDTSFTLQRYAGLSLPEFFSLSALVAAHPMYRDSLLNLYTRARIIIKERSVGRDMNDPSNRAAVYQSLYGMRAATEEVLLQTDSISFSPITLVKDEPSSTPSAIIAGITVHSGDLLVSRGGAEVSAMISRGNDYPGNFSHVAMLYVDKPNGNAYLIEAHIEKGVAVASVDQYIADKKLRFMVLRTRADLPLMKADPMLPQKAAKDAWTSALSHHIPYDFKMNFRDSTALFCSEVGSLAYRHQGIQLWQSGSTISSAGVIRWLQAFGVQNFVTQMPGDLEYDQQLSVVAEWRDGAVLKKDHIDNAVMDVLLQQADSGRQLKYEHWKLPFVRVVKGWCMLKNSFGKTGIIPEGMSATQALKNQYFVKIYQWLRAYTDAKIARFIKEHNYFPPYWQMIALAKEAANEQEK